MKNEALRKPKKYCSSACTGSRTQNGPFNTDHPICLLSLKESLSSNLPERVLNRLEAIASTVTYAKGAVLVREGYEVQGIFIICEGRVKLSLTSQNGKRVILRIAERGDIIGLPGTVSGQPAQVTAEALEPIRAKFIVRAELLKLIRENGETALRLLEALNDVLSIIYERVRHLGLSSSAAEKLAHFFLLLIARDGSRTLEDDNIRVPWSVTHEEISQMIGICRETVTRLLLDFKRRGIIKNCESADLLVSKRRLEMILNGSSARKHNTGPEAICSLN